MLYNQVVTNIIVKIQSTPFFSIITDTTQDISKTDQLSQIIRYVTIERDERGIPMKLEINESFLGFQSLTDHHSENLADVILGCIEKNGLTIKKLRGQGYDGAANMSGVYSGVQARIKKKQPLAVYIHCMSHNLNLVLNDSCDGISEIKNFYGMMEKLYTFFKSVRRWSMLQEAAQAGNKVALKRVYTTRWSSRYCALQSLRHSYIYVLIVLTKLELLGNDKDEKSLASGLKKYLESITTVLLIVFKIRFTT